MVAEFLTGSERPAPVIVQIGNRRELDLAVEVPVQRTRPRRFQRNVGRNLSIASPMLVQQHRSTLIFVNTRRLAERVAHHLGELLGENAVASHHGSLSRNCASPSEKKLKAGEIRALVATASLELGIDIGTVDLVCQIGSPRSDLRWRCSASAAPATGVAPFPKAEFLPPRAMNLLECAALVLRHASRRTGSHR